MGVWCRRCVAARSAVQIAPEGGFVLARSFEFSPGHLQLQKFSVDYEFPVVFTRDCLSPTNRHLIDILARRESTRRHRAVIFVDSGVAAGYRDLAGRIAAYAGAHAEQLELIGDVVLLPGGEDIKNDPQLVPRLLDILAERRIDRHSYAIAIGGGAVLDAVGYAAAIFHRGVRHVRLPTTVLSQDDSGVGVKNAVNHLGVKNLVGTFAPPWGVLNDFDFLDRLPDREKRGGMAEAVKVALIRDVAFLRWIEANVAALARFTPAAMEVLVKRSAALHMCQIAHGGDPFETGSARPLDYGHWSAHKLERLTHHSLSHGEAVAIGIALDTRYSVLAGYLTPGEDERTFDLLSNLGFSLWHEALRASDAAGVLALVAGLADFREHLGGELTVTLLAAPGRGIEVHDMDTRLVAEAIDWLDQKRG